jgi:hypothetical protein
VKNFPKPPGLLRDVIAVSVCNWVMRHVASDWYETTLDALIKYGADSMARDLREGLPSPPPWGERTL